MATAMGERAVPMPIRHTAREGAKRMSEYIDQYGITNEDEDDEDFTPQRKRSRVNGASESPTQESSIERDASATIMNESLEPSTSESPPDDFRMIDEAEDSLFEAETSRAVETAATKTKKTTPRRPRAKKTPAEPAKKVQKTPRTKRQSRRAAVPDEREQQLQTPTRANSSQALSYRSKPGSLPSSLDRELFGSDEPNQPAAPPAAPPDARAAPKAVQVEVPSAGRVMLTARLRNERDYYKKRNAIHESLSTTKKTDLLEVENEYLQQTINEARKAYPDVLSQKKHELAALKNTYLKGLLDVFPKNRWGRAHENEV